MALVSEEEPSYIYYWSDSAGWLVCDNVYEVNILHVVLFICYTENKSECHVKSSESSHETYMYLNSPFC